jgi:hypothetical protein
MSTPTKLAVKHACRYDSQEWAGHLHTRGTGKPTRKACQYCKGPIDVETGLWGAFHWVADARCSDYAEDRALRTFTNQKRADAYADGLYEADNRSDVVIRWIDKTER